MIRILLFIFEVSFPFSCISNALLGAAGRATTFVLQVFAQPVSFALLAEAPVLALAVGALLRLLPFLSAVAEQAIPARLPVHADPVSSAFAALVPVTVLAVDALLRLLPFLPAVADLACKAVR